MRITHAAVAAVALALALAACSNGAGDTTSVTSQTPSTTSTSAAPSSAAPTVINYGGAKLITGTETFFLDEGHVTTHADGTSHTRHGTVHSTFTSSDARVAGTAVATWNSDRWGTFDNGALVQWGRMRIKNSGGAWVGRLSGIYTSETSDRITYWFRGTGGYAGLSMYLWEAPTSAVSEYPFTALVYRGTPPPR